MQAVTTDLYINGQARPATDGATYDIVNPARPSEVVGHAAAAGRDDVDAAMSAAHEASPAGRPCRWQSARRISACAEHLNANADETAARAQLLTREHGKTLFETNIEVTRLVDRFAQVAVSPMGWRMMMRWRQDVRYRHYPQVTWCVSFDRAVELAARHSGVSCRMRFLPATRWWSSCRNSPRWRRRRPS